MLLQYIRKNLNEKPDISFKKVLLLSKLIPCQNFINISAWSFYSLEHEPIHVHGKFQESESKAEIVFENGKFKNILITEVKGKKPLDANHLKKFVKLVETFRDDIVRKWIDFFIYNIEITPEKITKKI